VRLRGGNAGKENGGQRYGKENPVFDAAIDVH
jgi:hypothetical protein